MTSPFSTLYFIRHGQTDWNVQDKLQGHADIPLNAGGEQQALQLKELLADCSFAKIISSDLSRAHRTAHLATSVPLESIIVTDLLRDRNIGSWSGRTVQQRNEFIERDGAPRLLDYHDYLTYRWDHDIESYADIYARIVSCITTHVTTFENQSYLFATHSGVLRALLYTLDFKPGMVWKVANCAFLKLRCDKHGILSIDSMHGIHRTEDAY